MSWPSSGCSRVPASASRSKSGRTAGSKQRLDAAIKRFQKKHSLMEDGVVGYMTFKALVSHADAFDSKVLRDFAKERIGPPPVRWTRRR